MKPGRAPPRACPVCGGPVAGRGAPAFPFCSSRCRLVDLGAWLDEAMRIPGTEAAAPPADGTGGVDVPGAGSEG